jgi:hypothetical protein
MRPQKWYGDTHYRRMLVEDAANGLVPYGDSSKFKVSLEPENAELEYLIGEGLSRDGYRPYLSDSVRSFLREATQTVFAFREAPYEIVYLSDPETEELVTFGLSFILPWTLKRHSKGWVQTIPPAYAEQIKSQPQIHLPGDSILHLHLPTTIDRYFDSMMADLESLGHDMLPEFGMSVLNNTARDFGFDFQEWRRWHNVAINQATRASGWNARNVFPEEVTEYYFVQRFLRFEKFKLEIRESLVSQLNEMLQTVGKQLGFTAKIVVSGLPDAAQVDQSMQDLESGAVSFADVMKPYMPN